MPSKYILLRLARSPFNAPSSAKSSLRDEFCYELDTRRQVIALSDAQECNDWCNSANDILGRCNSSAAKRYVWAEFAAAQSVNEPILYKAAYKWLNANKQLKPKSGHPILDWAQQEFSLASLLSAACALPEKDSVDFITKWLHSNLELLNAPLRVLPVQHARNNASVKMHIKPQNSYSTEILWLHVLLPALPYLPNELKNPLVVPYLPLQIENSLLVSILSEFPNTLQPWILSNTLFRSDFDYPSHKQMDEENALFNLASRISQIEDPTSRAFIVWDMLHRKDNISLGKIILKNHAPRIAEIFDAMGCSELNAMRIAMQSEWMVSQCTSSPVLPNDIFFES